MTTPEEYAAQYRAQLHRLFGAAVAAASAVVYQHGHWFITIATAQPDGPVAPATPDAANHRALRRDELLVELRQLAERPAVGLFHQPLRTGGAELYADAQPIARVGPVVVTVPATLPHYAAVATRLAACWNICRDVPPADLQPTLLVGRCPAPPAAAPGPAAEYPDTLLLATTEGYDLSLGLSYPVRVFDAAAVPFLEYAERLAACWNVCRGIPTARLLVAPAGLVTE